MHNRETRYTVTFEDDNGNRQPINGRKRKLTFCTREEADQFLVAMIKNNHLSLLKGLYGGIEKLEVRSIECYPGGDPVSAFV